MHFLSKKHCFYPKRHFFAQRSPKSALIATNLNSRRNSVCLCFKFSSESKLFGRGPRTTSATLPTEENHFRGAVTKEVTVQRRRGGSNDVPNRSHYQREPTCVLHRHTEHFGHKCSLRGSKIVFSKSPRS